MEAAQSSDTGLPIFGYVVTVKALPRSMANLFWETRPARVDLTRDAPFVLARVLEFGRAVDVRWLVRHYGLERIHQFLATAAHPEISPRTIAFWRAALHAEDETWRTPPAFRRSSFAYWRD